MVEKIRMRFRRWRCDHFDHPYRQVKDMPHAAFINQPADVILSAFLEDAKWCGYCQRKFVLPILHPNCRCAIVPMEIPNE